MILAIDPGPVESAYVVLNNDLKPVEFGKASNGETNNFITALSYEYRSNPKHLAVEMVASYGMAVGVEVFETVFWIGRFWQTALQCEYGATKIYRKDVKTNLCGNMKAKDSNIRQALIDRFGGVGTKKNPGWFYGFKGDIWQAYAVGVTYYDMYMRGANNAQTSI